MFMHYLIQKIVIKLGRQMIRNSRMYMKYSIGYDKIDEAVLKLKEMYRG